MSDKNASTPEPAPIPNDRTPCWELVMQDTVEHFGEEFGAALIALDMKDRDDFGRKKYGTPLQPFNGRDALTDAYQEALDLCVYLRQAIAERGGHWDTRLGTPYKCALEIARSLRMEIHGRDGR